MNTDTHGSTSPAPTPTPKKTLSPKTRKLVDSISRGIARGLQPIIKHHTDKIAELSARLAALETQVAVQAKQIKDGATLAFRGPWKPDEAYPRGAAVQHDGHCWIALRATSDIPGGSDGWQLAVRRGKEGKAGRDCPNCRTAS